MLKKIIIGLLSVYMLLACGLCACGSSVPPDSGGSSESPDNGDSAGNATVNVMNDLVKNFWDETTLYDESIMLVAETDGKGNVLSAPKAKLLFTPATVEKVVWYYHENNGGKQITFKEGDDFTVENGYIVAKGQIEDNFITERKEFKTSMPYVTDKQLTGELPFPGLSDKSIPSTTEGLYLPFTEGYQIVQMQLSVTYKHAGNVWAGEKPAYQGEVLSNVVAKLKEKKDVGLFVYGDSISTGANSSSVLNIPPMRDTWMKMVADNLASWYGAKVTLTNESVGGWTSANGVGGGSGWVNGAQVQKVGLEEHFSTDLKGYVPDIAIIGFGMNDASNGVTLNNYCNNIISMIKTLRKVNPDCDVLLLGTMLANPCAKNQSKNQAEFSSYLTRVAKQFSHVAVLDIGKMHRDLLNCGKRYTEMSSNNVNHPNDFMARVYAMNILTTLTERENSGASSGGEEQKPQPAIVNEMIEEYKNNGYNVLFDDPYMKNGIRVLCPVSGVSGDLTFPDVSTAEPSWTFAQWATKYDLTDYAKRSYSNGGYSFTYKSKGKIIGGKTVPAKVLKIDCRKAEIYMELNAEVEYDAPRKDGESWPHTLISQDFDKNPVKVSEQKDIVMAMDYTVTKFEDKMGSAADPSMHCAQLVWYITLQNRTPSHKDFGSYVWFGVVLWDNRMGGQTHGGYAAQDGGKEDATNAFIYQPDSNVAFDGQKIPVVGENRKMNFHLLDSAKAAFNLAKQRGYLGDTTWEDLYIGSMNFGFENTGTYNTAAEITSVGVYYK